MPTSRDTAINPTPSRTQPVSGDTLWQSFEVRFDFPVSFTEHLFSPDNPTLRNTLCRLENNKRHRVIVFIDDGLYTSQPILGAQIADYAKAHADVMELVTDPVSMPGGERIKSELHFIEQMQKAICDHQIDRHSYVLGIGGGALLDAVGLVAATSHRGLRHIRIPTTVLSQNDSGVGVKNGVNLFGQKNYVGTFAPPFAVLNDHAFIESLPARDCIAGMAEAVKVALIRDAEFYLWLERHADDLLVFERAAMQHMIRRCAELHMHQIGQGGDPFEMGTARPLDFGHWSAHRLETLTRYRVRHGEAVAIGIALDTHYSVLAGLLSPGEDERICFLLEHLGFRLWHPALDMHDAQGHNETIAGLRHFQEHLGGQLTITLLNAVGNGIEVHHMDEDLVLQSIDWLRHRTES